MFIIAACAAMLPGIAAAQQMFIAPEARSTPDGLTVELVFVNDGDSDFSLPEAIPATLQLGGRTVDAVLTPVSAAGPVPPGGFAARPYRTALAITPMNGEEIAVRVFAPWDASALVIAEGAAQPAAPPVQAAESTPPPSVPAADAEPPAAANLSTYEPIYAVLGTAPFNAKLQFSFKYSFINEEDDAPASLAWLRGVHFGYTQTMFWDLGQESSPFRSIDFKPELFYRYAAPAELFGRNVELGFQLGARHESNGRADPFSRSLNTAYLQPSIVLPLGGDYQLVARPRAWFYYGDLEDNPDIADYRGWTGLGLDLRRRDGAVLAAYVQGNPDTGKGSVQADLSYPLRRGALDLFNLSLHAQFFAGYGDNLFDYNRSSTRFRIGLSIVQ